MCPRPLPSPPSAPSRALPEALGRFQELLSGPVPGDSSPNPALPGPDPKPGNDPAGVGTSPSPPRPEPTAPAPAWPTSLCPELEGSTGLALALGGPVAMESALGPGPRAGPGMGWRIGASHPGRLRILVSPNPVGTPHRDRAVCLRSPQLHSPHSHHQKHTWKPPAPWGSPGNITCPPPVPMPLFPVPIGAPEAMLTSSL